MSLEQKVVSYEPNGDVANTMVEVIEAELQDGWMVKATMNSGDFLRFLIVYEREVAP